MCFGDVQKSKLFITCPYIMDFSEESAKKNKKRIR